MNIQIQKEKVQKLLVRDIRKLINQAKAVIETIPKIILLILIFVATSFNFYYIYNKISLSSKTEAMLKMSYWDFDQSEQGWRSLSDQEAVKIIDQSLQSSTISPADKVNLNFHAGQIHAFLKDYQTAIERFRCSKHLPNVEWEAGWNAYVDATIAFLKGDNTALTNAKVVLEKHKDMTIINGTEILYPNQINLKVVERLVDGLALKKRYHEVY